MKMRSTWAVVAVMSALATLSGCATVNQAEEARALAARQAQSETDTIVGKSIENSSRVIQTKLGYIESLERGIRDDALAVERAKEAQRLALEAEKAARLQPASLSMLDTPLRIVWQNDSAEDLLKQLAGQLGLGFEVKGTRRAMPNVTIVSESMPVRKILESVGSQVDRSADVVLVKGKHAGDPSKLEIRYK